MQDQMFRHSSRGLSRSAGSSIGRGRARGSTIDSRDLLGQEPGSLASCLGDDALVLRVLQLARRQTVGMRRCAMRRPNPAVNGGLERAIAGAAVTEPVLLAALGGLNLGAAFYVRKSAAQGEP
jgi:hypothetical protein